MEGTIRGASGGYLRIQLDGIRHTDNFHPTWNLVYRTTDQGGGEDLRVRPKHGTPGIRLASLVPMQADCSLLVAMSAPAR